MELINHSPRWQLSRPPEPIKISDAPSLKGFEFVVGFGALRRQRGAAGAFAGVSEAEGR